MKFLRATRKLRAERVGAGGGISSGKSGPVSEMVYVVWPDIRLMDMVDAIVGAGVGCRVNLRVSPQNDHVDGIVHFSVLTSAKSNATDDRAVSRGKRWKGANLLNTTTAPTAKGMKSTSRYVDLMAEVMVNPSNNRRLRVLYTRESPNVSSLLDQPRHLGEMRNINRITR